MGYLTPKAYAVWLGDRLEVAAAEAMNHTAEIQIGSMRRLFPSSRTRTRRALKYRHTKVPKGHQVNVRLDFREKYPVQHTKTLQLFRQTWRRTVRSVKPVFAKTLTTRLKEI